MIKIKYGVEPFMEIASQELLEHRLPYGTTQCYQWHSEALRSYSVLG